MELLKRRGRWIWHTRVTVTHPDGSKERPLYCLDTEDENTANRKREKLLRDLAAGRTEAQALATASAPDTVQTYAEAIASRLSTDDNANLRRHVFAVLGAMALDEVRPVHVKNLRDKVAGSNARRHSGKRKAGEQKELGAIKRLFACAVEDEILEASPASDVKIPKLRGADREIAKPRTILAEHAHLDPKHLQEIERGSVNATVATLLGIARALKVSLADLFDGV
jgi:DNA-binding XRE family transcriptional regulator